MSKVLSIHEVTLKPETNVKEFEDFVKEEASTFGWMEGQSHRFVKYESGKQSGAYLVIFETSKEIHNLPKEEYDKLEEELFAANPQNRKIIEKISGYVVNWMGDGTFTTYMPLP